jgi:hypothetical protein
MVTANEYSENKLKVCDGDSPTDIPAKLAAADKRLDVALSGVRKLEPAAEKFYVTLNDDQKTQANLFLDLPGRDRFGLSRRPVLRRYQMKGRGRVEEHLSRQSPGRSVEAV